jgi:signal transduction histidine kinase/CheY-like chemotaxis protein
MKSFDMPSVQLVERIRANPWLSLATGPLLVVLGVLFRYALLGNSNHTPYVTFYSLSTIAAVLGGWPGGLAATAFSCAAVTGLFAPLVDTDDWISLFLFIVSGVLATGIVEMLYRGKLEAVRAEAAKEALERRAARDGLLSRTATSLLKCRDPRSIFEQVCREAMDFLDCDVFLACLFDEGTERQHLAACAGVSETEVSAIRCLECRRETCGRLFLAGDRVADRILGATVCPRDEMLEALGIKRYCCQPLLEQGRTIGALMFGARAPRDLGATTIEFTGVIAQLISMAVSRARAEERLQEATATLRKADRRKDEFLATIAHELRNPLAPILTGLEVLKRTEDDRERRSAMVAMMERQAGSLVRLVDDLLEVSRITQGKIELRKESVDISKAIRLALETSRPFIRERSHRVKVNESQETLLVLADLTRLAQVFSNLLNNAAKFCSSGGSIEISSERLDDAVVVTVRDNGRGISPEALPHIFELFVQSDQSAQSGGLGIGLALVRNLVELHGGTVSAQSAGIGKGSEFVVSLPAYAEMTPAAATPSRSVGPLSNRVLVIDDNRDAADALCALLNSLGATARAIYDGRAGAAAVREFAPDTVLLDLGMPDFDGYQTAKLIRQNAGRPDLTLVAVTGWGQEDARAKTAEAGFDEHLTKPASLEVMQQVLSRPRPVVA